MAFGPLPSCILLKLVTYHSQYTRFVYYPVQNLRSMMSTHSLGILFNS